MAAFSDFYKAVLNNVPGVPNPSMDKAILDASRTFLEKTGAIERELRLIDVTAGVHTYTLSLDKYLTIQGQTHTDFNGVGDNGTFDGGSGYAAAETITLRDGTLITVDTVASGVVTEFTVTTATDEDLAFPYSGYTLDQSSTSGSGTGFSVTLGANNETLNASQEKVKTPTRAIFYKDDGEVIMNPRTSEELRIRDTNWKDQESSMPREYTVEKIGTIRLIFTPEETVQDALFVRVMVGLLTNATSVPDELYDEWETHIMWGSVYYLASMPQKPWTNPQLSQNAFLLFNDGIQEVKREKRKGFGTGDLRIKIPRIV